MNTPPNTTGGAKRKFPLLAITLDAPATEEEKKCPHGASSPKLCNYCIDWGDSTTPPLSHKKEELCEVSGAYGKDNNKNLIFYCEYCDTEMDYSETRVCPARVSHKTWEEVTIDNSAYGQMKGLLGALNLDRMRPVLDQAISDAERKVLEDIIEGLFEADHYVNPDTKILARFIKEKLYRYAEIKGLSLQENKE
jgi:hypothetical protein